eukprot:TRINITY_DN2380_c0_g1_i1.p1 TRINITY_DN2380_c0_g1~~TRINITY_DN2380_c0_g1_i1.p1  ORF type:complete len:149 (-),score=35.99 TRINITY_DN2380_c0_g1_i1:249-695(-)
MGHVSDDDTRVILKKLAMIFPSFYLINFVVSFILCAAFGIDIDGSMPFDFEHFGFGNNLEIATWLTLTITFLLASGLLFFIVQSTGKSWDYACTIAIIHFAISCIVMDAFPTNWVWWVTVIISTFILSSLGELTCYYLRDMKEIPLDH